MNHNIEFSDPGASQVIGDLRTILSLILQIRAAGGGIGLGIGGGGIGGITGVGSPLRNLVPAAAAANAGGSLGIKDALLTSSMGNVQRAEAMENARHALEVSDIIRQTRAKDAIIGREAARAWRSSFRSAGGVGEMAAFLTAGGSQFEQAGEHLLKKEAKKILSHISPLGRIGASLVMGIQAAPQVAIAMIAFKGIENAFEMFEDPHKFIYGGEYMKRREQTLAEMTLGKQSRYYFGGNYNNMFRATSGDAWYDPLTGSARGVGWQEWNKKNILRRTWDIGSWFLGDPGNWGQTVGGTGAPHFLDTPELQELAKETVPLSRFLSGQSDLDEMQKRAAGKDKDQRHTIYKQFLKEYNIPLTPGFVYQETNRKVRVRANAGVS